MKTIFILFVFIQFAVFSQEKPQVRIRNYANEEKIEKFKKLEFGIELPLVAQNKLLNFIKKQTNPRLNIPATDFINPYLEWDIDLEAIFIQPDGVRKKIDGFYTRDYRRNKDNSGWEELPTTEPFRVRISPSMQGDWKMYVRIRLQGKMLDSSELVTFSVFDTGAHGYIVVHPNKKNFALDGNMKYFFGQNFPCPEKLTLEWTATPAQSHCKAPPIAWDAYYKDILSYSASGGNMIRTIQTVTSSLLEWEEKGNYYKRMPYGYETDSLLDIAAQNNIFIYFNLMIQEPFMLYADYHKWTSDWDRYIMNVGSNPPEYKYALDNDHAINPYNNNPSKKLPHEMFLDEDDLKYHEQRIRYYFSRYGYSTQIALFEQLSEPFHINQFWTDYGHSEEPYIQPEHPMNKIVKEAVANYTIRMSKYVKEELQHNEHLIAINAVAGVWHPDYGWAEHDASITSEYIDVISFNHYSDLPNKFAISRVGEIKENSLPKMIKDAQETFQKPVYVAEGEHGVSGTCDAFTETEGLCESIDNMCFPFIGIASFAPWHLILGDRYNLFEAHNHTRNFIDTHLVPILNDKNGNYTHHVQLAYHKRNWLAWRSDDVPLKEHFYYLSESKSSVCGLLKNRTFNLNTMVDSSKIHCLAPVNQANIDYFTKRDIAWDEGKDPFIIEDLLKRTEYEVIYFDFITGTEIERQKVKTKGKGTLVLKHPNLTAVKELRPIIWYTVKKL